MYKVKQKKTLHNHRRSKNARVTWDFLWASDVFCYIDTKWRSAFLFFSFFFSSYKNVHRKSLTAYSASRSNEQMLYSFLSNLANSCSFITSTLVQWMQQCEYKQIHHHTIRNSASRSLELSISVRRTCLDGQTTLSAGRNVRPVRLNSLKSRCNAGHKCVWHLKQERDCSWYSATRSVRSRALRYL